MGIKTSDVEAPTAKEMAEIYLKTANRDKITSGQTYGGHGIKPCFGCC